MSGPIVRKYGFPNFDKIFGAKPLLHGVEDQPAESPPPSEKPDEPRAPTTPAPSRVPEPARKDD